MGFFDGIETWCANRISNFQERRNLRKWCPKEPIPSSYKKEIKAFWKKYRRVSPKWAWYYASKNGILDPRYIPHTLYYTIIDQYFNSRKLGYGFNDKNYYSKIFAIIRQPQTVIRNIGGIYLDSDYQIISREKCLERILENDEVICKPTQESGSGRGILFWNNSQIKEIEDFLNDSSNKDFIVQQLICQHDALSKINPTSVNTIRICSLLRPDKVVVLSSCLRMGVGASRVDNHHAGGMSCGINDDGTLEKYAYYMDGTKVAKHPNGVVFEGYNVPSYNKIVELVREAHQIIGNFKLVGWDIAVDKNGDPVLIECNMRKNGIELHQFSNGPLFGDLTEMVLDEVFEKK